MQVLKMLGIHKKGELKMLWFLVRLCQKQRNYFLPLAIIYSFLEYLQYRRCY